MFKNFFKVASWSSYSMETCQFRKQFENDETVLLLPAPEAIEREPQGCHADIIGC